MLRRWSLGFLFLDSDCFDDAAVHDPESTEAVAAAMSWCAMAKAALVDEDNVDCIAEEDDMLDADGAEFVVATTDGGPGGVAAGSCPMLFECVSWALTTLKGDIRFEGLFFAAV